MLSASAGASAGGLSAVEEESLRAIDALLGETLVDKLTVDPKANGFTGTSEHRVVESLAETDGPGGQRSSISSEVKKKMLGSQRMGRGTAGI